MKTPPTRAKGRVPYSLVPKRPHQWEAIESVKPEVIHICVYCFKQKPGEYNNYNECPGKPDLFLHFKEDIQLIMKDGK